MTQAEQIAGRRGGRLVGIVTIPGEPLSSAVRVVRTGRDKAHPIPHPALAIEKQAQAEIRQWVNKYGAYRT